MKSIIYQMINVIKRVRRLVDAEMQVIEMPRTAWQVLFRLHNLGSCTQKELLSQMEIDAGHLARILEDFEEKNYIVRKPYKKDRRCLVIEVTEYGQEHLMPHVIRCIAKENAVLGQNFTAAEKDTLRILLSRLEKNLEEYHD